MSPSMTARPSCERRGWAYRAAALVVVTMHAASCACPPTASLSPIADPSPQPVAPARSPQPFSFSPAEVVASCKASATDAARRGESSEIAQIYQSCLERLRTMETEGDLYGRVVVAEWAGVARQNDAAADALRRKRDSLGRSIASDLASGQPPHQLQTYQAMVRLVGEGDSSGLQLQPGGERDSALLSNFWESRLEWCWKNEMSAAMMADW